MGGDDSAARRAIGQQAALRQQIDEALARDPAFQVLSVDGLAWICPYTGTAVPTPFGGLDEVRAWLMQRQPWRTAQAKPLAEVRRQRWRVWLRQHLEGDGRLRLFGADGRWLNPFTAQWVRLAFKPGDPPAAFIDEVAGVLDACPQAEGGEPLPRERLDHVFYARTDVHRRAASKPPPAVPAPAAPAIGLQGDDTVELTRTLERIQPQLPPVPGCDLAVHHEPAAGGGSDFTVAGRLLDGRVFLALGEVLGGGTPSALAMPVALQAAMGALPQARGPLEVLRKVGTTLRPMLAPGQGVGMHALVLDAQQRTCLAVCAGLPPAVRVNLARREVLTRIGEPGPALVQVDEAELPRAVRGVQFALECGDTIVLWTTGLLQAADLARQPFGEARAFAVLVGSASLAPDDLVATLANAARDWTRDRFRTDVSVLALRCR